MPVISSRMTAANLIPEPMGLGPGVAEIVRYRTSDISEDDTPGPTGMQGAGQPPSTRFFGFEATCPLRCSEDPGSTFFPVPRHDTRRSRRSRAPELRAVRTPPRIRIPFAPATTFPEYRAPLQASSSGNAKTPCHSNHIAAPQARAAQ